jgi:hypothetical protein
MCREIRRFTSAAWWRGPVERSTEPAMGGPQGASAGGGLGDPRDTGKVILLGRNTCQMFWLTWPSRAAGLAPGDR